MKYSRQKPKLVLVDEQSDDENKLSEKNVNISSDGLKKKASTNISVDDKLSDVGSIDIGCDEYESDDELNYNLSNIDESVDNETRSMLFIEDMKQHRKDCRADEEKYA